MNANILELNDSSFDQTISKGITLVDFWAEWCGPCKALTPNLEALANEFDGQLKIAKVDIDSYPDLPARYSVRSIPALLLFKDGQQVDMLVGNQPEKIREMLTRALA